MNDKIFEVAKEILMEHAVLIVDTREQKNHIWKRYKRTHNLGVKFMKLEFGDYSFMINPNDTLGNLEPIDFRNLFAVERKSGYKSKGGGFAELRGNLIGKDHSRFKKEFNRAVEAKCDSLHLLIENAESYNAIESVPVFKIPNESFIKTFDTFIINRNKERVESGLSEINIIYCMKDDSCLNIQLEFFKFFKQYLRERYD